MARRVNQPRKKKKSPAQLASGFCTPDSKGTLIKVHHGEEIFVVPSEEEDVSLDSLEEPTDSELDELEEFTKLWGSGDGSDELDGLVGGSDGGSEW